MSEAAVIYLGDCVAGMAEHLGDGEADGLVTSIPFGSLFSYSHKAEDIGNCRDGVTFADTQFGLHLRFWLEQVRRVLAPGAVAAIHVQQLNSTAVQHGRMGIRDFRGEVIKMASAHDLAPHGEVAIPKNPQRVAQARKLHSLLFATARKDSRALAPCANDYVLFFRAPGKGRPVKGLAEAGVGQFTTEEWKKWARGAWVDVHDGADAARLEGFTELVEASNAEEWRWSGIWDDILEIDVLQGWKRARDEDDEKHVCPLQLEVIRRCLRLYTSPGDLVLDPFVGIGSTAVVALELGRRFVGFEIKESYCEMARRNVLSELERQAGQASPMLPGFERHASGARCRSRVRRAESGRREPSDRRERLEKRGPLFGEAP